ncbi:MAG: pitrilysin family protein [Pseudomonadota bacterium]
MRIFTLKPAAALAVAASALLAGPAAAGIEIAEETSPAGIVFWHVEEPSIPMVALEVRFEGGAALDPAGLAGLSRMTVDMLDEGAGDLDATAFAAEADALSMRMGFSAGRDATSLSARFLTETLTPAAALLAQALAAPRFDADALDRVRARMLSSIASSETDPGTLARDAWYVSAFAGHPYAIPARGTAESVAAVTLEDLAAQVPRLMSRDRATVAVVGAIDAAAAGVLIDQVLAGLPETAPADAVIPPVPPVAPPAGVEVIELDVPQATALFGHGGLERSDPDYIPAFVMNYVLGGGGFSSRLMTEVREKRGLAYGVYSYLSDLEGAPLYLGSVQTENARIAESLSVIRAEWARMAAEGVTDEELADAKRYLTGAFPLRFDTNAKIAGFMIRAQQAGLSRDYVDLRNGLIEAVTREDIARVAARLLDEEALSIVVVGTPEGL